MPTAASSVAFFLRLIPPQRGLLVGLLALLYYALIAGPATLLGKAAFVAHLGFFMLWQPFVHAERRLSPLALAAVPTIVILAAAAINSWVLVLWIMILAGIVGGKVSPLGGRMDRVFYLLALGFLVVAQFFIAVPQAVPLAQMPREILLFGEFALPAALVIALLLPREQDVERTDEIVDFINSVFVALLLAVLLLACLANMLMFGRGYVEALLQALMLIGGTVLLLSWAWNPHAGFAGLGDLFSRYLLSIGLPVEQVLQTLADLAARETDPERFLELACVDIQRRLPWVRGGEWVISGRVGHFGERRGNCREFAHGGLILRFYTRQTLSPVLLWHLNLLAQLLAEFHADKQRALDLKAVSYQQAIYETGARLTHDVKNLLQSLTALCAALSEPDAEQSPSYQALLRRQLPAISARLTETLGKLRMPQPLAAMTMVPAGRWWDEFLPRIDAYDWAEAEFKADADCLLPHEVFAGAVDNLLRNVSEKRMREPDLRIHVQLESSEKGAVLTFCDNGTPMPPTLTAQLLLRPVASEDGLGIGLYHAARLAETAGYRLILAENRPGRVCFSLLPA